MIHTKFISYRDFLTPDACSVIIEAAKPELEKLKTLGKKQTGGRIGDGTWLSEDDCDIVITIREAIAEMSGLPIENQEGFHVIRYSPGGKYDAHYDYFEPGKDYYKRVMKYGGQRVQTWIMYLNDEFGGGETDFPEENVTVVPELGMLVGWNNIDGPGKLNHKSKHAGLPVTYGEKWIAVIWVREFTRLEEREVDDNWV
jgi:prolyl 4-hydroxylase